MVNGGAQRLALVAHQGAEVAVVVLQLLLEEGDGGGPVQDDPRLGGRRALAAAVCTAHRRDVRGPEGENETVKMVSYCHLNVQP